MIKIALTGNIASGKSSVETILKQFGYSFLNTDDTAHKILESNQEVIQKAFKDFDILDENGIISREKLGKLVFTNKDMLQKLEGIVHPLVKEKILEFFEEKKEEELVFVGIPQLFECNMQDLFDKKVLVYCKDSIRIQRLIKRNAYSEEYAKIRINSQIPQEEKIKLCDIIIDNSGSLEELKSIVEKLPQRIQT